MWRFSAIAAILSTATLALADVPATTSAAGGASSSTPYWNPSSGTGPLGDMPAADIRNVPVAYANAVRTRWTFNQSLFDLNNATRLVRMTMDRQPDYKQAQADEKAAYEAMEKARNEALADLRNNPAYNASEGLKMNVNDMIADEAAAKKPDETKLAAMAKLKLQYGRDSRKLEVAALERDANYQDARKRYVAAAQRVADFRDAQTMAIATDDTLQSLRKAIADARIEKHAARAFYDSSLIAQTNAVNYALNYRRVDVNHGYGYGAGYGPYNYGYGPAFVGYGVRRY